jgi:hypothetical protein
VPPSCEFHLVRDWDAAWRVLVRPWLQASAALRRDYVIVPTRGQAHALKLRCVREGVALLGVEFLTPGLARRKWQALEPATRPALDRELLLFNLRALIEEKLVPLAPEDAAWGVWKSLQSDPERALDDFEQLTYAGFTAADFALAPLREIFGELAGRIRALGYDLAPAREVAATAAPVSAALGGRLLLHGFTAEQGPEFFVLGALARRCEALTVILPEPDFGGGSLPSEHWIQQWEQCLGVEPSLLDEPEAEGCQPVAELWTGGTGDVKRAKLVVGHTREDEMGLVADEVAGLLAAGGENIAVVFPRADAAHLRLARLLEERGLPFNDLLETAGPPPVDGQMQRALLRFYERGSRLEEMLELWPLLRALNLTTQPLAGARDVCERVFEETQSHALAANLTRIAGGERVEWKEVARVAGLLLPAWPGELTMADALQRFAAVCGGFKLAAPESWPALAAYAARDTRPRPARVVFATLAGSVPEKSPVADAPGRGLFAPVTLTTRRRAAALAWSHVILVEGNAGVWPARADSTCWLTDERRTELNTRGAPSPRLLTGEDRFALEKQGLADLARNTRGRVIFSAALFDEEEPELKLAPNSWVERVVVALGLAGNEGGLESAFARLARKWVPGRIPDAPGLDDWSAVWRRRRDASAPFDDFFLSAPPETAKTPRLAARMLERGVQDPAELWFEAVLKVRSVDWRPMTRARKKLLGQMAHRMLAAAMRGRPVEGVFTERQAPAPARAALAVALAGLRDQWPRDRYWDSFLAELGEISAVLLEKVQRIADGAFAAVEVRLPEGATVPLGATGERLGLAGRMDLALLDRPEWSGAQVDIVDFKTGVEGKLTAQRMAGGASLQLGLYLAAVQSLGAAGGRVWMVKPDAAKAAGVEMSELPGALAPLVRIAQHFASGRFGALTPDRTEFSQGFEWPLACAPIRQAVLQAKFAATFGAQAAVEDDNE